MCAIGWWLGKVEGQCHVLDSARAGPPRAGELTDCSQSWALTFSDGKDNEAIKAAEAASEDSAPWGCRGLLRVQPGAAPPAQEARTGRTQFPP